LELLKIRFFGFLELRWRTRETSRADVLGRGPSFPQEYDCLTIVVPLNAVKIVVLYIFPFNTQLTGPGCHSPRALGQLEGEIII
jgi:hypothetical protein